MRRPFVRKVEIAEKMLNCSNFLVDCQHGALVEAVVSLDFWGEGGAWVSHGPVALAAPLPPGLVFTEPRWLDGEASGERPPAGYRARSLGNTAGRAHPPAGREHLLNSALSRQRGEFLGSGALLGVSREILGKASRPCPEWGPPHPLVPLNPLGSSHPPQRGDSERQPKLLLTSVPFPSWPLAGPAREAISWKAMSGPAFSWPHPPVLRAAHPLAGAEPEA